MKQRHSSPVIFSKLYSVLLLLAGAVSFVLSSPKWTIPICAWTAPAALLFFFRYGSLKRKYAWLLLTIVVSQLIAFDEVVPVPGAGLVVFVLVNSLLAAIPYLVDKAFFKKSSHLISILPFPVAFTAIEFFSSFGPWGAWSSVANTQVAFSYLAQLASVTGIWGISFLLYGAASYIGWLFSLSFYKQQYGRSALVYPVLLVVILLAGAVRYYTSEASLPTTRIAGVTVSSLPFFEALYKDANGKTIEIPATVSPASSDMQQANAAFGHFIEQPDDSKFITAPQVLNQIADSLFTLSIKAAKEGASIIVWSEGSIIVLKQNEEAIIGRAQQFAKDNQTDILMAMAVLHTGVITPGKKFMENKTLYIDGNGTVQNTFYKNKPVPGVEPSIAGNGDVPVLSASYGNVATSICYDADFPSLMHQLGKKSAGLLLLPSGDWKAISPYHSEAAIYRAIENGCSLFRQANGGLSIATDYKGKLIGTRDFFQPGEKLWLADVPVHHVQTLYIMIGDSFGYVCLLATCTMIVLLFFRWLMLKIKRIKPVPDSFGLAAL